MRINDVTKWLRTQAQSQTTTEVAQNFGVQDRTADCWLHVLASEGKVTKSKRGGYATWKANESQESSYTQGHQPS